MPSWQCHRACDDPVTYRVLPHFCLLRCKISSWRWQSVTWSILSVPAWESALHTTFRQRMVQSTRVCQRVKHIALHGLLVPKHHPKQCVAQGKGTVATSMRSATQAARGMLHVCNTSTLRAQHSLSLARLWTPSGCEQVSAHWHLSVGCSQQPLKRIRARLSDTVFALTGSSSDSGDPIFGIVYVWCSAIAACSGGETFALRLTVNYSVLCTKKWSNHPTSINSTPWHHPASTLDLMSNCQL